MQHRADGWGLPRRQAAAPGCIDGIFLSSNTELLPLSRTALLRQTDYQGDKSYHAHRRAGDRSQNSIAELTI